MVIGGTAEAAMVVAARYLINYLYYCYSVLLLQLRGEWAVCRATQ